MSLLHKSSTRVLSKRKREVWFYICIAHLLRCFGDRSFSFFMPLYLSKQCLNSTLRPTAALSFVQNLSVVLLSTTAAKLYKRASSAFVFATVFENVAVSLIGISLHLFLHNEIGSNSAPSLSDVCEEPLSSSYFRFSLVCGAIDAICSSLLSMVISKEWVALLFFEGGCKDEKAQHDLAKANAFLSQIDLAVGTVSPLLVSYLISSFGYHYVLIMTVLQHVVGALLIIYCIHRAIQLCPDLVGGLHGKHTDESKVSNQKHIGKREKNEDSTSHVSDQSLVQIFKQQPVQTQMISVAYVVLYFTILSPGAMLNAWMNSMNEKIPVVSERTIAIFGSMSQFCGVIATFVTPLIIRKVKRLRNTSMYTQWFQAIFVWFGFYCFYQLNAMDTSISSSEHYKNAASSLMIQFLISIGLSRVGLWSFDLVERQIVQESVRKEEQTLFFNGERSATQFLSLLMMASCYIFPEPESFLILVVFSVMAVSLSSVLILIQARL